MICWWNVIAPGFGSIQVKAQYKAQALSEAQDRFGCEREDITVCTEAEPAYQEDKPVRDFDGRMIYRKG